MSVCTTAFKAGLKPADQVKSDAFFCADMVKQQVSAWPGRVFALVAAESDPFRCEQILKRETEALLTEILNNFKKGDY